MNIREVIDRLQELAEVLPDGLDSEVRVRICNGHSEAGFTTRAVEVDTVWHQDKRTLKVLEGYAALIGHPHTEIEKSTPVTLGLEEAVERWSAEVGQARSVPEADAGPEVVGSPPNGRHAILPQPGQRSVQTELGEDGKIRYLPGHPDAVIAGCLCDPTKNNYGHGAQDEGSAGHILFIINQSCPLHVLVDPDPSN
jgi:hypothetical protein